MNFLILVGGNNKRIGENKALLKIGGRTLVERVIDQVNKVRAKNEKIILVGENAALKEYLGGRVKMVGDLLPEKGPLGGIYSGLISSSEKLNFILGCDMPFLNFRFINYMCHLPPGYDILLPFHSRGMEPLHAIYSRACLPVIEKKLGEGQYKIRAIFPHLQVRFVEEEEIKRFCSPEYLFFNINRWTDVKKAREFVVNKGEAFKKSKLLQGMIK